VSALYKSFTYLLTYLRVHGRSRVSERWSLQWCNISSCLCADGNVVRILEVALTMLIIIPARQRGSGPTSIWWITSSSSNRCGRTEPLTTSPGVLYIQLKQWPVMTHLARFLKAGVSFFCPCSLFAADKCFSLHTCTLLVELLYSPAYMRSCCKLQLVCLSSVCH